jgi:hypothetical protein
MHTWYVYCILFIMKIMKGQMDKDTLYYIEDQYRQIW